MPDINYRTKSATNKLCKSLQLYLGRGAVYKFIKVILG